MFCSKFITTIIAAADTLLSGGSKSDERRTALTSHNYRCHIAAQLEASDPYAFGAAAARLRPELDRCADALQSAKLNETDVPRDVDALRTRSLLSCLAVVGRQVSCCCARQHYDDDDDHDDDDDDDYCCCYYCCYCCC
jgi:hypothetical protein